MTQTVSGFRHLSYFSVRDFGDWSIVAEVEQSSRRRTSRDR
jgi:hypothetical protein